MKNFENVQLNNLSFADKQLTVVNFNIMSIRSWKFWMIQHIERMG
jgi:hypothetical protein